MAGFQQEPSQRAPSEQSVQRRQDTDRPQSRRQSPRRAETPSSASAPVQRIAAKGASPAASAGPQEDWTRVAYQPHLYGTPEVTSAHKPVQKKDPGKTGGKVTLTDFTKAEGVTEEHVNKAGKDVAAMNRMSLAQMKDYLGGEAKDLGPRSTQEMLGAIASGVLPRWVARVGAKANFDGGSFGYSGANQVFATEPSDVVGLSAAQALVKVGWTPAQLGGQVGKEIGLCVLDTSKVVGGAGSVTQPDVDEMNWQTLAEVAKDETKNAYFYSQLAKFKGDLAGQLTKEDLPAMFELAAKTPVGAKPDTEDAVVQERYALFRAALGSGLSASELFSGMGATVSETGQLGAREVMVKNNGTGFQLTAENSVVESLGVLQKPDVEALMSS